MKVEEIEIEKICKRICIFLLVNSYRYITNVHERARHALSGIPHPICEYHRQFKGLIAAKGSSRSNSNWICFW